MNKEVIEIKVGDVVYHKADNSIKQVRMVVEEIDKKNKATCSWIDDKGYPEQVTFELTSLIKIKYL